MPRPIIWRAYILEEILCFLSPKMEHFWLQYLKENWGGKGEGTGKGEYFCVLSITTRFVSLLFWSNIGKQGKINHSNLRCHFALLWRLNFFYITIGLLSLCQLNWIPLFGLFLWRDLDKICHGVQFGSFPNQNLKPNIFFQLWGMGIQIVFYLFIRHLLSLFGITWGWG